MKARNAPGAAVAVTIFYRENDGWAIQLFGDTRRSKPDYALMPAVAGHDDEMLAVVIFGLVQCKLGDLHLHLLSLAVTAVQQRCKLSRLAEILFFEELNDVLRYIHSARCIDTRANAETDVVARHIRAAVGDF